MNPDGVVQSDPYASIRAWWGEALSQSLITRMLAAPSNHLDDFRVAMIGLPPVGDLPSIPPANLRPVLRRISADSLRGRGRFRYLRSALLLLLYVDEIAIEDPLPICDREHLQSVLQALLLLKPLHESRLVTFFGYPGSYHHPSRSHTFMRSVNDYCDSLPDTDPVFEEMGRLAALDRRYNYESLMFMSTSAVGLTLQLVASAPGAINLLAGSAEEAMLMGLAIRTAGAATDDLRALRLTALSAIEVPAFRPAAIPTIRLQSDEFQAWRQAIGGALTRINTIVDDDVEWQTEARAVLQEEIDPIRSRLSSSLGKSPAMASARSGLASLTYSGLGAVAGGVVGGSPVTGLVGAASAKGVEFGVNYLRELRERRANRAMLDLALSIYEAGP